LNNDLPFGTEVWCRCNLALILNLDFPVVYVIMK